MSGRDGEEHLDSDCFLNFGSKTSFAHVPIWSKCFRFSRDILLKFVSEMKMELRHRDAHTRETLGPKIEMDPYFLRSEVCTYNIVPSMIGIGTRSMMLIIRQVSRAIYARYESAVRLRRMNADLAYVMTGYQKHSTTVLRSCYWRLPFSI